jgi:hypothetical protein
MQRHETSPTARLYVRGRAVSDEISRPEDIDIFRLDLQAGDRSIGWCRRPLAPALYGVLRVFGAADRSASW